MAISIDEFHEEVVDEFVRVLSKYPWTFVSGKGASGEFRFHKANKCSINGTNYSYKISRLADNTIEILVLDSRDGLLFLRLKIHGQTGKLDGWDWKDSCRCEMTSPHQFETVRYFNWPQAVKTYAERVIKHPDAKDSNAIYSNPTPVVVNVEPFNISTIVRDARNPSKPAIAIFACDRPNYFCETVDSLLKNKEIDDFDVYLFQDKPKCGDPKATQIMSEQIDYLQHRVRHAVAIRRPVNWGCGRNLIDGRRQLFDNLGYDRVYVFEDDMVVTPNYISFCEDVWKWSEQRGYADIGTVQGWSQCHLNNDERITFYDHGLNATLDTLWGYSISLKAWDRIRDDLYKYEDTYLQCEYQERNHDEISAKIRSMYATYGRRDNGVGLYPDTAHFLKTAQNYFQGAPTGQDGMTNILLFTAGYTRLAPVVSRAKYIGEQGINFTEAAYKAQGYQRMTWRDCDAPDRKRFDFLEMLDQMPDTRQIQSASDLGI